MRSRDWFVVGACTGIVYSLWRNPQGCGCCLGCLGFLALAAAVFVGVLFWVTWPWSIILVAGALGLRWYLARMSERLKAP